MYQRVLDNVYIIKLPDTAVENRENMFKVGVVVERIDVGYHLKRFPVAALPGIDYCLETGFSGFQTREVSTPDKGRIEIYLFWFELL